MKVLKNLLAMGMAILLAASLLPQVEVAFAGTDHRRLSDAEWVPAYMEYINRDLARETETKA